MTPCPACGRPAPDLTLYRSVLDREERQACTVCILANAEPVADVVRIAAGPLWETIPLGLKRSVTVYDCGAYLSLLAWAKRQRQQLVPCAPDPAHEEDEQLLRLMELQRRSVPETPPMPAPRLRDRFQAAVLGLVQMFVWRHA